MITTAPPMLLNPRRGPIDRWQARPRVRLILLAGLIGTLLLLPFDAAAFRYFIDPELRAPGNRPPEWYHVLRQFGNMLTWLLVGLMVWGIDAQTAGRALRPAAWARGLYIVVAGAGAGLLAEIAKILVARERPISGPSIDYQGYVHHWPVIDPLLGQGNLGFPSSHTAVAFGAAIGVARLLPGALPVLLLLALGCAWTRLLMGAHFLTDVAGGIVLAWAWVAWLPKPGGPRP